MKVLPDNILKALPEAERKAMGKAGKTKAECEQSAEIKSERDLQKHMINLLRQRGLMFLNPPMHKRSGLPLGWPDFTIFPAGKPPLFVEAKTPTGKLSEEQLDVRGLIERSTGSTVHVIRSIDAFRDLLNNKS